MWIWNTNIYFWQQWPVYLHDRNDHGLIGCRRELSTVLPAPLQTAGRHTRAPIAHCSPLLSCTVPTPSLQAQHPGLALHTQPWGDTALTACPSPTKHLEDASKFPFPSHRFLQPSHTTCTLSQSCCPTARLGSHLGYPSRDQTLHALLCWAPGNTKQPGAEIQVSTSTCPWLTHCSQTLLPSWLVMERLPALNPYQNMGVPGSPAQGTPVS